MAVADRNLSAAQMRAGRQVSGVLRRSHANVPGAHGNDGSNGPALSVGSDHADRSFVAPEGSHHPDEAEVPRCSRVILMDIAERPAALRTCNGQRDLQGPGAVADPEAGAGPVVRGHSCVAWILAAPVLQLTV